MDETNGSLEGEIQLLMESLLLIVISLSVCLVAEYTVLLLIRNSVLPHIRSPFRIRVVGVAAGDRLGLGNALRSKHCTRRRHSKSSKGKSLLFCRCIECDGKMAMKSWLKSRIR